MADQRVEIVGDSGSHERVALDLMKLVISYGDEKPPKDFDGLLNLYKKCRLATFQNPS